MCLIVKASKFFWGAIRVVKRMMSMTKVDQKVINSKKRIAVLITGQLRFRDLNHFTQFREQLGSNDTFISTYAKYKSLALKITTEDRCIFKNEDDIKVQSNNMYQWCHLDFLMKKYHDTLKPYDIIIKIRTDIHFPTIDTLNTVEVRPETIYCCTDILFYGTSTHFLQTFSNFWSTIISQYSGFAKRYKPINYQNIIRSNATLKDKLEMGARFTWLIVPQKIFSTNFYEFRKKTKENLEFLNLVNNDSTKCKYFANYMFGKYPQQMFSSEQSFCIHCFNSGRVENSKFAIKLSRDKHCFNL